MSAIEIFKLWGSILVDTKEADKSIQKTGTEADNFGSKLGNLVGGAAKVGAAIATGIAVAGAGIMKIAIDASTAADNIDELADKVGFSTDGLQQWNYALGLAGTSVEGIQGGIKSMTNKMQEMQAGGESATALFDKLGVSITDSMSQEDTFNAVVLALQGMDDGAEKAALANDIFSKSAMDLMPILNGTATELEATKQKAIDMGTVMSGETIDAGVAMADSLDNLKASLGAVMMQGIGPMLPMITGLMNEFVEILPSLMEFIKPLIEKLVPVLGSLIEKMLPIFLKLLDAIMPIMGPLVDVFLSLVDTVLVPLIDLLIPLIDELLPVFIELFEMLMPVLLPLIEAFMQILNLVLPPLIAGFKELSDMVLPLLGDAFESLKPVIDAAMKFIGAIVKTVVAVLTGDWEGAWKGIKETFTASIDIIKAVAGTFRDLFTAIWQGIKDKVTGIWNGMVSGIQAGIATLQSAIDRIVGIWTNARDAVNNGIASVGNTIQSGFNSVGDFFGLASGGTITRSGGVLVGEQGPELLNLPRGASVIPLDTPSGGSGIVFERGAFDGLILMDDYGVDRLMERVVSRARGLGVSPA